MRIDSGIVTAICAVIALIGGALIAWINHQLSAIKNTQKLLFSKHDDIIKDLSDYKLHIAESFVNREVLKEALQPIYKSLDRIEREIQDAREVNSG